MKHTLAVVPKEPSLPAERSGRSPTVQVKEAMLDLFADCARQAGEVDEDRKRVLATWNRETAEFEPEVRAEAFRYLLRHNPRNPFRPTVQDIVTRCELVRREWEARIRSRYVGSSKEELPTWCARLAKEVLRECLQHWADDAKRELERFQHWRNASERERQFLSQGEFGGYPPEFTDRDRVIWFLVGKRQFGIPFADWPADLLQEFDVPIGPELARITTLVEAQKAERERKGREERERLEALDQERMRVEKLRAEAKETAMARPDVAAAQAAWNGACERAGTRSGRYTQALNAFQRPPKSGRTTCQACTEWCGRKRTKQDRPEAARPICCGRFGLGSRSPRCWALLRASLIPCRVRG
jgi:hypothetical protein